MRIYRWQFFKTKEEAKAFQKEQGYGALISYASNKRDFRDYLSMQGESEEFAKEYPYVIAWNSTM